jgi:AcrR family transcriptional regulator
MPGNETKRRGRRPPRISVESILETADEFDLNDLSMPALAARLGVSHGAIYHYFASRQALIAELAARRLAVVQLDPAGDRGWRELATEAVLAAREIFAANAAYVAHVPASIAAAGMPLGERLIAAYRRAGLDEWAAMSFAQVTIAWSLYNAGQKHWLETSAPKTSEEYHRYLADAGVPEDSPMHELHRLLYDGALEEQFMQMLDVILDTAERHVAQKGAR